MFPSYKLKSSPYNDKLQLVCLRVASFLSMFCEVFRLLLLEQSGFSSQDPEKKSRIEYESSVLKLLSKLGEKQRKVLQ